MLHKIHVPWLGLLSQTCHGPGGLHSKHLLLTVLMSGESKSKVLADATSGEDSAPAHGRPSPCRVLTRPKGRGSSPGSLL